MLFTLVDFILHYTDVVCVPACCLCCWIVILSYITVFSRVPADVTVSVELDTSMIQYLVENQLTSVLQYLVEKPAYGNVVCVTSMLLVEILSLHYSTYWRTSISLLFVVLDCDFILHYSFSDVVCVELDCDLHYSFSDVVCTCQWRTSIRQCYSS